MIGGTLSRYFGFRFLSAVTAVFAGLLVLVALIDFIEMLRRTGDIKDVSALYVAKMSLYRVPFLTERIMRRTGERGAAIAGLGCSAATMIACAFATQGWQVYAFFLLGGIGALASPALNGIVRSPKHGCEMRLRATMKMAAPACKRRPAI